MSTAELANQLVAYCKEGKYEECYKELYDVDCVSIEPKGAMIEVCNGLEEMAKKGEAWNSMMQEFHGSSVSDPIVADNHFSCTMMLDATYKQGGGRKWKNYAFMRLKTAK